MLRNPICLCAVYIHVCVYAHGSLFWSIFLCQGHLLRGLEKLYYKFMIVVLDIYREECYMTFLPNSIYPSAYTEILNTTGCGT